MLLPESMCLGAYNNPGPSPKEYLNHDSFYRSPKNVRVGKIK